MIRSHKRSVFLFQFLHKSDKLVTKYRRPRYNSSVYNIGPRRQLRYEKLILKYRIAFIRLLCASEYVYFRHLVGRRMTSFIVCCQDYPFSTRVHLYLKISKNLQTLTFFQALLVNFDQGYGNTFKTLLTDLVNRPIDIFRFHPAVHFNYPNFTEVLPCIDLAFNGTVPFSEFCTI